MMLTLLREIVFKKSCTYFDLNILAFEIFTAASHQGELQMFWLHLQGAGTLSFFLFIFFCETFKS